MKYIILAFKSRNDVFNFIKVLKRNNITSSIINTPRSISTSCGLSIKIFYHYYPIAIRLIKQNYTTGLIGAYLIETNGIKEQLTKIF